MSAWNNMSLRCVSTLLYQVLLWHSLIGNISSRNYWIDDAFPTFKLDVYVLTFSFDTRFTNQKIATYAGQSSGTAKILFQGPKCWCASFSKSDE